MVNFHVCSRVFFDTFQKSPIKKGKIEISQNILPKIPEISEKKWPPADPTFQHSLDPI